MRARILLGLAVVFCGESRLAADDPQPVGVILTVTGERSQIKKLSPDLTVHPEAGMAIWPGEILETGPDATIRFIFCPGKTEQTLVPGSRLPLGTSALEHSDLLTDVKKLDICHMPEIGPPKPPEDQEIQQQSGDCAAALALNLFRGMQFELADDTRAAAEEYRQVGAACRLYPNWTQRVKFPPLPGLPITMPPSHGKTYALLIGVNSYTEGNALQFAANDAEAFKSFLMSPRGGLVAKDQIALLKNDKATKDGIHAAIRDLEKNAQGDQNTLIIFLAGHGALIKDKGYFLPYRSENEDPESTEYPMDRIGKLVKDEANRFSRVIAFVDICHANYSGDPLTGRKVRKELAQRNRRVGILMASGSEESAYEDDRFAKHGVFTYFVLAGLNGDELGKTPPVITFNELKTYVSKNVSQFTANKQNPEGIGIPPTLPVLDDSTKDKWDGGIPLSDPEPPRPLTSGEMEDIKKQRRSVPQIPTNARPPQSRELFEDLADCDPLVAVPLYEQAVADRNTPAATKAGMGETLRVALADHGQEILAEYIEGEQSGLTQGDFDQGREYFEHAVLLPGASAFDESRLFFFRGREMIFERKFQDAIQSLERSILLDPNRAYSYNALGLAYLEMGNFPRAIAAFNDALQFAPNWSYPRHNLALAFSQQGNFAAAQDQYQLAMRNTPHYSYLPYNLGLIKQRMNRLDDAEQLYKQALIQAKENRDSGLMPTVFPWTERADILNALGTVAAARNKNGKAQRYYRSALVDAPALAAAKYNLAMVLSQKVKTQQEAVDLWRQNAGAPDSAIALASRLALGDYFAGQKAGRVQAIAEYVEAVKLDDSNLAARRALAQLYIEGERWPEAYEQCQALRSHPPQPPEVAEQFAQAAAKLGGLAEAADACREAARLFPNRDRKRVERKLQLLGN
jgi:tetratricopeptide (TPR) repeat protein